MKTKIKDISIENHGDRSRAYITDSNNDEYYLDFELSVSEDKVKEAWNTYNKWHII